MSSSPNVLLVAAIRPASGNPEEFLADTYGDISVGGVMYEAIQYEDADRGIFPKEEHFCIYENLTYGWGDTTELDAALAEVTRFKTIVEGYCQTNNCTFKIYLSANYY